MSPLALFDKIESYQTNFQPAIIGKLFSLQVVRIFTSSTFTDMLMERNTLMEYVYPKIKEYCREKHGLEYQVVDMRWGVRDEMTDEHMTTVRKKRGI